ncbi:hypothetical protein SFR_5289 [Streptomyces sp. FR-008]|nr:hypothetical protein SFR_5289 [Streptomyces sp. FR-008]
MPQAGFERRSPTSERQNPLREPDRDPAGRALQPLSAGHTLSPNE